MRRRIIPAAAAVALVLTGATACSGSNAAADCTGGLEPGALSNSVTVLGAVGEKADVSIPKDVQILSSQRTIVSQAEQAPKRADIVTENSLASVNVAFYDSLTGQQLYASPDFGTDRPSDFIAVVDGAGLPALVDGLRCTAVGDRVVIAASPEDSAGAAMSYGLTPGASLVVVADVLASSGFSTDGRVRNLPSGFPAVATDDTGRPGIVLPPQAAPKKTTSALRIAGTGKKIEAGDRVIAQVLTVSWDGQELKNTWTSGPANIGTEDQIAQSGMPFRTELTGQKVGSQVVVIEPGEDGAAAQVSVVDILAAGS